MRRGIIVKSQDGFAENAYRYYLTEIDGFGAQYTYGEIVGWPPEAGAQIVRRLADRREPVAEQTAPAAERNSD